MSWALIPSSVHTVNGSHAPRKADGGIAINHKPILMFIPRILDEFCLDAQHFRNPIKKEATVDLFIEVCLFTYLKLGVFSSKSKQAYGMRPTVQHAKMATTAVLPLEVDFH
jgi:hypothetical protein